MTNQTIGFHTPPRTATLRRTLSAFAATLTAMVRTAGREIWEFLKVLSERRAQREMIECANSIAATRPELAARLRRAAYGSWSS